MDKMDGGAAGGFGKVCASAMCPDISFGKFVSPTVYLYIWRATFGHFLGFQMGALEFMAQNTINFHSKNQTRLLKFNVSFNLFVCL